MELSNDASPMLLCADPIFGVSTTKVAEMGHFSLTIFVRPSVCGHEELKEFLRNVVVGEFL
jgi:hypothetical protein